MNLIRENEGIVYDWAQMTRWCTSYADTHSFNKPLMNAREFYEPSGLFESQGRYSPTKAGIPEVTSGLFTEIDEHAMGSLKEEEKMVIRWVIRTSISTIDVLYKGKAVVVHRVDLINLMTKGPTSREMFDAYAEKLLVGTHMTAIPEELM